MSRLLCLFLFSLPPSLSEPNTVRILAASPFYLPTGAPYRDLLTVNMAKTAANLFLYGENTLGNFRAARFDLSLSSNYQRETVRV